ncbi:MAG: prepilin-type N-terminal cleavage/methylation domain-containing protein [Phycisphaerales bacterium]|nr:prepilin-type N-terminal cleavage/methylation domain-containing protein [Phycisphaerales bacterium]
MRTDEQITRTDRIAAVGVDGLGVGARGGAVRSRTRAVVARGFSLIEVLMAVLILALGLLGLGAVLPVVVRQQAQGTEQSVSTSALQSAVRYLQGNSRLAPERWANFIKGDLGRDAYWREGLWVVPAVDDFNSQSTTAARQYGSVSLFPRFVEFDRTSGLYLPGAQRETVLMEDRLYPSANSGETAPLFVWDLAVRRDFAGGGMQIAVFVRKIDTRAGNGLGQETLFGALLNPSSPVSRRAVSVDNTGRPTLDGRFGGGRYSVPLLATVGPVRNGAGEVVRDRIGVNVTTVLDPGSQTAASLEEPVATDLLTQPGQKLIDNLGNVYTVEGRDEATQVSTPGVIVLKLSSPMPASVSFPGDGQNPPVNRNDPSQIPERVVRQVVFTPHVPAAVSVFNMGFELAPDVNYPSSTGGNN